MKNLIKLVCLFVVTTPLQAQYFSTNSIFTGAFGGGISIVDVNGDGAYDVFNFGFTGQPPTKRVAELQLGGIGGFSAAPITITGVSTYADHDWADLDNDNDLDLIMCGIPLDDAAPITKVYRNDGNAVFTEMSTPLIKGMRQCGIKFGDYDNDGDQDVLLQGNESGNSILPLGALYRNDGSFVFGTSGINNLAALTRGSLAWGDVDKDGDLDIMQMGINTADEDAFHVYRNDVANPAEGAIGRAFTEIPMTTTTLDSLANGDIRMVDYDADGQIDVVGCGAAGEGNVCRLYKGNGNFTFAEYKPTVLDANGNSVPFFTGLTTGKMAIGDLDNNGMHDFIMAGQNTAGDYFTHAYVRSSGGAIPYTKLTPQQAPFPGILFANYTMGDFNNDNRLDVAFNGFNLFGQPSYRGDLFRNITTATSAAPSVPTNLNFTSIGGGALLRWNASTDDKTPAAGLTYNVRIGSATGGFNIVSPAADLTTGKLLRQKNGNAGYATSFRIKGLQPGTYYWSVQAIDAGYRSSAFATQGTFTVVSVGTDVENPQDLSLQVSPNPFADHTEIRYTLPQATAVKAEVFDMMGRLVSVLSDGQQEAGSQILGFDAQQNALSSGMYFLRISIDNQVINKAIHVIR